MLSDYTTIVLYFFAVCFKLAKGKIEKKSRTCVIVEPKETKTLKGWLEKEGIDYKKSVVLFKRVSKDFKTQEGTKNETTWKIGTEIVHTNWLPEKEECGEGKFHACSRSYFCDEFRNNQGDIYIAIEIALTDLYPWFGGLYPHKIAFRKGRVLYQCDRYGKEING